MRARERQPRPRPTPSLHDGKCMTCNSSHELHAALIVEVNLEPCVTTIDVSFFGGFWKRFERVSTTWKMIVKRNILSSSSSPSCVFFFFFAFFTTPFMGSACCASRAQNASSAQETRGETRDSSRDSFARWALVVAAGVQCGGVEAAGSAGSEGCLGWEQWCVCVHVHRLAVV